MNYNANINTGLPSQKRSLRNKDENWRKQCVDAICSFGQVKRSDGRTTAQAKQINYDMVNSIIDENDMKYVLNPYGVKNIGNQPSRMRDINLVVNKINILKGEEMNRPFYPMAGIVGGEAISEKEKLEKDLYLQTAIGMLAKELGIPNEPTIDPETGEEIPLSFESVEKYINRSRKDIREQWSNFVIKYETLNQNLPLKFTEGWEHALITAEEIYYIGIVNNQPKVRVCNPLGCDFDRNLDNANIEDGDWFKEDRWMTTGQILDEYGEYLTDAQVKLLDEGGYRPNMNFNQYPGFAYTQDTFKNNPGTRATSRSNSTHHLVTHCVWKSMKKIGFVKYTDENDIEQMGIVDESFSLTDEMKAFGYTLTWRWIPDIWHGTKIGDDMYVNIESYPNQTRSMDNPSEVKLPYVGRIYNSTNTIQTSFVDLIKPHQYLYNIVWYRLEQELAKAKGKKMVMDIAQIPRSEGIDLDKWMYMFDNVGIAFINSFEEGKDKFQGQTSQFNQFQSIDMGLSQAVGQYVSILSKIEQTVDKIVGITPQREGDVGRSETVGGIQSSVSNSSNITEPWFYIHNEIKKRVLNRVIETAKYAYPNNKKLHFMQDDAVRISVTIDIDKFADSDYGIFVTNSSKDYATFQKLEALATQALSSGAILFSDLIKMYKSESISELSNLIEESEAKQQQQQQEEMQQQQEMQQQSLQAQAQEKAADREFKAEQNQLDRETKIRTAVIGSMGFDNDVQGNEVNDMIKYGDLALKEMTAEQQKVLNEKKQSLEERKQQDSNKNAEEDRKLKREELKSKEKIETLKAKTAIKNKVVGEK